MTVRVERTRRLYSVRPDGVREADVWLEHTVPVDDHWEQFGPGALGVGWELGLLGLGIHLESGPVDREAMTAWTGSDEGKRFMTVSSDGWCEADVAAGASRAEAEVQAGRTAAAYTGS